MRNIALVASLAVLTLAVGCKTFPWKRGGGDNPVTSVADAPSTAALCNYLNDNADRVQSVQCNQLDMQCSQGIKTIGLTGKMVCQKPRNFRMSAYVFGKQELDMGSNNDEFWFWIARGDPFQFHCSYQALAEGKVRQLPIPVQPDWIIEAMGLSKCGPAEQYQVVARRDTVELVERTRSPQGKPIRKVTVFRRGRAREGEPQVTTHLLIDDATNKEICTAEIKQVVVDRGTGAVLPRKVVFYMPQDRVKLALTLDDVTVNGQLARPDLLFTRRPLNGVRSFDLALGRVDGDLSSIRQVENRER